MRTILHHLKEPWDWTPTAAHYHFCNNPDCATVYFGDDGSAVSKSALRTRVAAKEEDGNALLCHCFGVSRADAEQEPSVRAFVAAQTKAGLCSCETSNPSGQCCLRDFPKAKN